MLRASSVMHTWSCGLQTARPRRKCRAPSALAGLGPRSHSRPPTQPQPSRREAVQEASGLFLGRGRRDIEATSDQ